MGSSPAMTRSAAGTEEGRTFGDSLQVFGDVGKDAVGRVWGTINPVRRSLEQAITDNPVKAIGISLAVGALLGWLIKR